MRAGDVFFDTSVILYLLSGDPDKADLVEALLQRGGAISVQVLNEIAAVVSRKRALSHSELGEFLAGVRESCVAHPVTLKVHERGLEVAERYGFSLHDSMIVAAALEQGCRTLYSEDLQNAQLIEKRLRVVNPFAK